MIKTFKDGLTWLVDFISKPLAGWAIAISLGVFAFVNSDSRYKEGVIEGAKNSVEEIKSLNNSLSNRNLEIVTLKNNVTDFQKLYDDCNKSSTTLNLEDLVRKRLEESDRLQKILERKILNTEKQTNEISNIIKK